MPFDLELPAAFWLDGWKVKIHERERLEPPHVTIRRRLDSWRLGLRDGRFLDRTPPSREVPRALVAHVRAHLPLLRAEWDRMYPENPVGDGR